MFWKLCKFELKCSYRSYLFMYAVILLAALFLSPNGNGMATGLLVFIYGIAIFTLFIVAIVNIIKNYQQSMFTRSAYLTHTLPVPAWMTLLTKTLGGAFWFLLSIFVIIISIFLIALKAVDIDFGIFMEGVREIFDIDMIETLTTFAIMSIVSMLQFVSLIFFVISAVNTKYIRRYRTGATIVLYFVITYVQSMISGAFNQAVFSPLTYVTISNTIAMSSIYPSIAISLVYACLWYFLNVYILDNQMEIE